MAEASMAMRIKQVVLGTLADAPREGGSEWPEPIRDRKLTLIIGARGPKQQHCLGQEQLGGGVKGRTEMGGTLSQH